MRKVVCGNFSMVVDDFDEGNPDFIEQRLMAAENILRATAGINMEFEWEECSEID